LQRVTLGDTCTEWKDVSSGVPQGSVLGPILFTIYINDIDNNIASKILKFADDTKLIRNVGTVNEVNILRDDLNKMVKWSEDWQMLFNIDKCKVMHVGRTNKSELYDMGGILIKECDEEKDLGVTIDKSFKVGKQCATAAKKANVILGMIKRTFTCRNKKIMLKLYKSLVRPHLDYCIQVWRPHFKKDIQLLENVQRRVTKCIKDCDSMEYQERLRVLNLTEFEVRMKRADFLEVFKIMNGFEGLDLNLFFSLSQTKMDNRTRGHPFKLYKKRFESDWGKYVFSNRIIDEWNKLPKKVVMAKDVISFKIELDKYLRSTEGNNEH